MYPNGGPLQVVSPMNRNIAIVIGSIASLIMFLLSFSTLEQNEYGIFYYRPARAVDSTTHDQGTYFRPLGTAVYRFSTLEISVVLTGDKSVTCLSSDAIEATLNMTIYFKLDDLSQMFEILYMFNDFDGLLSITTSIARASIRDACGVFTLSKFFVQREQLQAEMLNRVRAAITLARVPIVITQIALMNIDLPDPINDAIVGVQLASQDQNNALQERPGDLILAQTRRDVATSQAKINIDRATGAASAITAAAIEKSAQLTTFWGERQKSFTTMMSSMGITGPELLDVILRPQVIASAKSEQTINIP